MPISGYLSPLAKGIASDGDLSVANLFVERKLDEFLQQYHIAVEVAVDNRLEQLTRQEEECRLVS